MATKLKVVGNFRGVAEAAFEIARQQTADLTLIKTKLETHEEDEALRLMRKFLNCPKPVMREISDEPKKRAVN